MLQIPDRKSQVVARVKAQRKAFLILIRKMFAVCGLRRATDCRGEDWWN